MKSRKQEYSSLFYVNPLPCLCYDLDTLEIVDINQAALVHYGYKKREFLSLTIKDLCQKEEISQLLAAHENIQKQEGNIFFGIFTHQRKSGELIRVEINGHKVDFENRKCILAVCQHNTPIVKHKSETSQMIDASLDVFCTIDEKGIFVYVSAAAATHWGYSPEELIGKPYQDFILKEDVPKTNEIITAIHGGQIAKSFYNRYRKKNGDIAYNLWSAWWDESAKLLYCVVRDAKERIEQEEILHNSEQRFKALVQESSNLIGILDAEGNYLYVSPTSISVLGMAPEEFIGRNAFEFIHPDDAERVLASLQKISTENKVMVEPFRFQNHKKEWRWVETVLTNMLENPAVKGIVSNSRDITDKIEEQRRLKLLESVITNTNDAILITEAEPQDEPGPKIIYVNDAFTKMTGYTAEEVIGKTPRILQGPNSNKEELAKLGSALRNWKPYEITTINYKKNGEEFWINFTVTPVANEKGWYTHWIAIERDVSEQKNKELEKDLINKISDIFNQNTDNDLMACGSGVCEQLTKFGDFAFAEMWLPDFDAKTINRVANYFEGKAGNVFYNTAKNLDSLALKGGISGHIWKNKATEIWDDGDEEWHLLKRKVAAKKAGIKSMISVPLTHKGEFVGALLIGTEKTKSALGLHLELFQKLESTIGAELSRKKIEIELAQIFNFTPDMICVAGFDGYIKRINPAGLELLGYSLEEMRSRPIRSFIHEDDRELTKEKQSELYNGGSLKNFENRYLTKDGKIVWLNWTSSSAPDHGIVYAVAKNITEEKKLRELNRQAGSLAKIGGWEVDLVNQSIFWSDEVHQMHETDPTSYTPSLEEAINFYREDFQQLVRLNVEKCISTNESYDFEAVLVTAKNKEIWVRTNGKAEFVDGICIRIYGSFQDINDRKESENRLLSISENLPGIVFQYIIHPDGTDSARYVSGAVEKLVGYTATEVVGNLNLLWDPIKVGGDYVEVKSSLLKSVQAKSKWTCRFKYVLPTGELRTYLGNGTPTFLTDGTILYNSIILDITQEAKNKELLKRYTLELERSNEELEQFAFMASHDLQEPLRMIASFMDLLQRKYGEKLDEKGHQYIHFATDGAKRMKQIILDLLEYSRATRPTEVREEVDINDVLSEFKQLRRKLISEKSASINYSNLPILKTYRAAITQILHCLLDNALKYSKPGMAPKVEINAIENKKGWKFSIKDNGIGIDPQFYDKIFIIFQRLHNREQYAGTGIGLSIAKRHVEFLGGRIWVESTLGEGTIFYFDIPKMK